jgi:flagellar biosynthesis component FlhA
MKKAVLATAAALLSLPCAAGELDGVEPSTQLYLRIPIGPAASREDRMPSFGLAVRQRYEGPVFMLDSRLFTRTLRMYEAGTIGGVEVTKILVVGGVAAGAAVAISQRTKTEDNQQQQQNQQKAQQQQQQQQQSQTPCTC